MKVAPAGCGRPIRSVRDVTPFTVIENAAAQKFHERYVRAECCMCEALVKMDMTLQGAKFESLIMQGVAAAYFKHLVDNKDHVPTCPWPKENTSCYTHRTGWC